MTSAHWSEHVNALQASSGMRCWLIDRKSLTQKLCAHCRHFQLRHLQQGPACCTADEAAPLGLSRRRKAQQREVVLLGDDQPLVYAHTVLPLQAHAADWPFYRTLGARSPGSCLFWRNEGVLLVTEIFSPAIAAGVGDLSTTTSGSIAA